MLTVLLVAVQLAAISADCAGPECPAEADDSVSLLAHRAADRRRRKCSMETGAMTTLEPLGATPPDFSAVMVDGDVDVDLVVGSASKVAVLVDSGLKSYIDASVSDQGTLSIKFSAPCEDIDDDPKVTVTSPSLPTTISASNDAQVQFPSNRRRTRANIETTVESMSLTATPDAKISLKKVDIAETLVISTDSDADVNTQHSVSPLTKITAKGDSQVQGGTTTKLEVDVSGDSQVKYSVTESASGSVTGKSKLKFKVPYDGTVPDHSAVTKDSSSRIEIDYD